jgi:hypothetical protein
VRDALAPGGTFAFEMGGLGNVSEIRAALLSSLARRVGLERAAAADPWFFPDEEWVRRVMEEEVGGWKVGGSGGGGGVGAAHGAELVRGAA